MIIADAKEEVQCSSLRFTWREILPKEFQRGLEITSCFSILVPPLLASKAIQLAVQMDSLMHLPHLKRIKKHETENLLYVLTGFKNELSQEILDFLMLNNVDPTLHKVSVPQHSPFSKEDFSEWSRIWPLTFRKPSWQPVPIEKQKKEFDHFMHKLMEYSKQEGGKNACLITLNGVEVVRAIGERDCHPLRHAIMIALNKFASLVSAARESKPAETRKNDCPETKKRLFNETNIPGQNNSVMLWEEKNLPNPPPKEVDWANHYLAKGATIYVINEPCIMCAMALIHSRIDLCAFIHSFPQYGGLVSKDSLHCSSTLNHTFHAIQGHIDTENYSST